MPVVLACAVVAGAVSGAATFALSPGDLLDGTSKAFEGMTRYELGEVAGRQAVRAICDRSASGLIVQRRIDLRETPVVEWSWGVANVFDPGIDEASKAGDDFAVRLSLVHRVGANPLATRAVTYVWASQRPAGTDWANPYVAQARVVAIRSGRPDRSTPWVTQRRNLRADFRRYFDREVEFIDAVAIMTDCDDRGAMTEAWYGPVWFLPEDG